jgi:hypothetical protein
MDGGGLGWYLGWRMGVMGRGLEFLAMLNVEPEGLALIIPG